MYTIRRAIGADAEPIFELMQEIYDGLENKDLFVPGDLDYIRDNIDGGGFTVVAEDDAGRLAGVFIFCYPLDSEENLGIDIGLSVDELPSVVHMDTVMVPKEARGHGLQSRMLKAGEEMVDKDRFHYFLATVSPDNPASIRSMEKNGYAPVITKKKYGGLMRRIYMKRV